MSRILVSLVVTVLLVLNAEAQESIFPDKALETAVRAQVFAKRNNQEPLTKEDVAKISQISGAGRKISNLAGIEHCVAVQQVDLANNDIVDVGPLASLKLIQSLTLKNNKIQSIEALKEYTKLQYLDLSGNQIKDLAPIGKSTNLMSLNISKNAVEDLQVLKQFPKLHSLYASGNAVKDWTPVGQAPMIDIVDVSGCKIDSLAFLKPLKRINKVIAYDNQIKDLTPIVEMTADESSKQLAIFLHLYLRGNPVESSGAQAQQLIARGVRLHFE